MPICQGAGGNRTHVQGSPEGFGKRRMLQLFSASRTLTLTGLRGDGIAIAGALPEQSPINEPPWFEALGLLTLQGICPPLVRATSSLPPGREGTDSPAAASPAHIKALPQQNRSSSWTPNPAPGPCYPVRSYLLEHLPLQKQSQK